jgi:hypothetical protein
MAFTVADRSYAGDALSANPLRLDSRDAERARVLAGQIALRLSPDVQLGLAFSQDAGGLAAHLQGRRRPAFLIAGEPAGDSGFSVAQGAALVVRREFGGLGLTVTGASGAALLGAQRRAADLQSRDYERYGVTRTGIAADRRMGPLQAVVGLEWLNEDRTVLGGYFHDAFGAGGADTLFLDASFGLDVAPGWWIGASARQGRTSARQGGSVTAGSSFSTTAWAFDLVRQNLIRSGDSIGLRLSQPLRVEGGGLSLLLPVSYDYSTQSATFATRRLNLEPDGREFAGELAWHGPAFGGDLSASAYYRCDPGHFADAPDEQGMVLRWLREF